LEIILTSKTQTQSRQEQEQTEEEGYSITNETISEDLLLRCWNKAVEQINQAIAINKESGVKYPGMYVSFFDEAKPMDVIQKLRWAESCRHKKSMEFITLDSLRAAGQISDAEVKLFGDLEFPRRELTGMTRHKQDDKEFLIRSERWIGLTLAAGVVTVAANNIDFTRRIPFQPDFVPIDPNEPKGPSARIVKVGRCLPGYETAGKIYLTPFTKENVLAAMQKAQRPTEPGLHGRISLMLSKDQAPNSTSAPDLDTFVNADFDELWKQQTSPTPQININSKDLANYVKFDKASKEEHTQYT
jgi:hypothetical protein